MALLPELIPADLVIAAELRNLIRRRLQREMRGIVGEVKEERLLGRPRLINELDAVVGPEVGRIPILRQLGCIIRQGLAIQKDSVPLAFGVVEPARR